MDCRDCRHFHRIGEFSGYCDEEEVYTGIWERIAGEHNSPDYHSNLRKVAPDFGCKYFKNNKKK